MRSVSSAYSVINFSKDQKTLNNGMRAVHAYIWVALIWLIGNILTLWASYGMVGAIAALVSNFVIIGWILWSYHTAFKVCVKRYKLKYPTVSFWSSYDDDDDE